MYLLCVKNVFTNESVQLIKKNYTVQLSVWIYDACTQQKNQVFIYGVMSLPDMVF